MLADVITALLALGVMFVGMVIAAFAKMGWVALLRWAARVFGVPVPV